MEKRIIVENVTKKFKIGFKKNRSALGRALDLITGREDKREITVLNNVSLSAKEGEIIGIIGRNGSGKSTLLRVIAGIYSQNSGKVKTNGEIMYLNAFNTGLRERLTMKENIFLMGSILGLSQKQIKNRYEEIVEFSGLKKFVDAKVYQFSDGMVARLAFSITLFCLTHSKPDILLLDEVLAAGGDQEFQEKAIKKMESLIKSGSTVLIVSHNLPNLEEYCDRIIWLDNGRIKNQGKPQEIIKEYLNS